MVDVSVRFMITNRLAFIAVVLVAAFLSSCSAPSGRLSVPSANVEAAHLVGPVAWHAGNERRCLSSGQSIDGRFIRARSPIGNPSGCGAERPFIVHASGGGAVALRPAATLRCPMIDPVDRWLSNVVQPAAERYLGQRVVSMKVVASYACRSRNSRSGAKLSEHGRANALDIAAFQLTDGRSITVKRGWNSWSGDSRFLKTVHGGACRYFTTVLGPKADRHHHDHFHFDLARHGRTGTYRVCR